VNLDRIFQDIAAELDFLWALHTAAGLKGKMCLFSEKDQETVRAKEPNLRLWFGPEEVQEVVRKLRRYYNEGNLPNSPLLLHPMVHTINEFGSFEPTSSGFAWCSALALGIETLDERITSRMEELGAICANVKRGDNPKAGLKIILPVDAPAGPARNGEWVEGGEALFTLSNLKYDTYAHYYLLSGLSYLTKHGAYEAPAADQMFGHLLKDRSQIEKLRHPVKNAVDAATCWLAYDRQPSLYAKFGRNVEKIDQNLRFYNLCARDISLFEATGDARESTEDEFEFFVPGWVPKAAITVMGATGGTGKSSLAHRLAVMASIDWREDETPKWLGYPLNKEASKGLVIYFSGEDSAAIVNARANMIDPEGRSCRLMLQHTDFGMREDGTKKNIGDFLHSIMKLPDVSLVVIDPARKYLIGDEDNAEVVSDFFEAIEEFALKKKCAMVVVHHLAKGAKPNDTRDIVDLLRGSQVFIDRPRVVIGMMRDGAYTVVGLSKNNIPPNLGTIQGERLFVRDPGGLDLVLIPGEKGIRTWTVSNEELEQIKNEAQAEAAAIEAMQADEAKAKNKE
jgi:hypothetical protein